MKTIVTALAALAVVAIGTTDATAQAINLTGQFQCVKQCSAGPGTFAYITQNGWELNLVNEAGIGSRGWIDYPGHIWAEYWNEGAVYSADGMTIQFDNGTVWAKNVIIVVPPVR